MGEKRKNVLLRLHEEPAAHSLEDSGREFEDFRGFESVVVVPLDEAIEHADFIKIDAEGYERNILEGACNLIKKDKPIIAMSAYHKEDDEKELPKLLKSIDPSYECSVNQKIEKVLICVLKA